jgi:serine/threonine protein kinase
MGGRARDQDANDPPLEPGTPVDGRYRIERGLGAGGMGRVYVAHQGDRRVALKIISRKHSSDARVAERFRREARVASQARHPHIVEVLDHGEADGQLYLSMELLDGLDLREAIALQRSYEPGQILPVLDPILSALEHAHGLGLVHRDLKPENVFLARLANEDILVKLLDFGVVKVPEESAQQQLTRTGTIVGTPEYMAPEQALDAQVDARADLYALGCVAYEMLCGVPPFTDTSILRVLTAHATQRPLPPSQRRPGLPNASRVDAFILRALEKQPQRRFQTATEMRRALAELAAAVGDPEGARRPITLPTPPRNSSQDLSRTIPDAAPRAPAAPATPPLSSTSIPTRAIDRGPLAPAQSPANAPSTPRVSTVGVVIAALLGGALAALVFWLLARGG